MLGSELGAPRALDCRGRGEHPGENRRPGMDLAVCCPRWGRLCMLFTATSLLGEAWASVLSTHLRVGKGLVQPSPLSSGSVQETFFCLVRCFCGSQLSGVKTHLETLRQGSSTHSFPRQALGYTEPSNPTAVKQGLQKNLKLRRWSLCSQKGRTCFFRASDRFAQHAEGSLVPNPRKPRRQLLLSA